MSTSLTVVGSGVPAPAIDPKALEKVLLQGDLASLSAGERVSYYRSLCESVGLNPLTKPFDYIQLNGKLTLYAKRECTEQLRHIYNVSVTITAREIVEDCFVVTARAKMPTGREDESIGAVSIAGLKGEARSNAMMKAETKAKRRVTLSICGLAFTDESEVSSIRGAYHVPVSEEGEIPEPAMAETLHEDIAANPPRETKAARKSSTPFNVMEAFGALKARYHKLKADAAYYDVLKQWGADHCNEFPAGEDGITRARQCYKQMSLEVADLEVKAAAMSVEPPKRMTKLADWAELSGQPTWVEVAGIVYRYDDEAGTYKPWIPELKGASR